jgi:hypothetical protein
MLLDHRKDVVNLDVRRIHQRVDALHAYLEAAVPAQVERCPCRTGDRQLRDRLPFRGTQFFRADDDALRPSAIGVNQFNRCIGSHPFRTQHRRRGQAGDDALSA